MPLYDDIVDALELDLAGGTIAISNQGATLETNEASLTGFAGVWLKFDATQFRPGNFDGSDLVHFGRNVFIDLTLTKTGGDAGFLPEVDAIKVLDATFDPSSPNFTKLQYDGTPSYVGDGNVSVSGTIEIYGGARNGSGTTDSKSETGIWYLFVSDYDYTYHGDLTIVYAFRPYTKKYVAIDHIHPSSTTAVNDSGSVRDDYIDNVNGNLPYEWYPKTLQLDTSDMKPGLYSIFVEGYWSPSYDSGAVIPFRNGLPISNVRYLPSQTTFVDYIVKNHETVAEDTDPTTYPTVNYYAPHVLVLPDDNYEIVVASGYGANRFLVTNIYFELQLDVTKGKLFDIVRMETHPLGFGDQFNWGLEPREAGWFDSDFCVMPNGDVYVVLLEDIYDGTPTPPSIDFFYFTMLKYTPVSNYWTTIETGFSTWGDGTRSPQGGICVETDGTDIFMAWWEWTGTYINGTPDTNFIANKTFKWHFRKYSPSTGTFTEYGSGQAKFDSVATYTNVIDSWNPPKIVLADDGTIYVFVSESDNTRASFYQSTVYCYKWNGSSWDDLNMPELDDALYESLPEPDSYVSTHLYAMMGNADGSTQYPCAIYGINRNDPAKTSGQAYWDQNSLRFVQYNGSTWETLEVLPRQLDEWWNQQDLEDSEQPILTFFSRCYNPALCLANGKVYTMVTRGGPGSYVWNMYSLKSDLSGWEEVEKYHPMIVDGDVIDTQPHMFTGPDDKPYVVLPNGNYQFTIIKLENVGSGGWITAGDVGLPLYGYQYNAITPRVKVNGEDVYLCGQIRTYGDWNYLSTFVWKGTRVVDFDYSFTFGTVSFNATVPLS